MNKSIYDTITITLDDGSFYNICTSSGTIWGYDDEQNLLSEIPQFIFDMRDVYMERNEQ